MKDTNPKDSVAQNKVPLGLVSPVAMAHEALALKAGAVKYGTANYRVMGANAMVYAHAAIRHLQKWINGEEFDQVDGTHHLGNVRACTAILLDCQHLGNLTDDRPPSMDLGELFDGLEQMSERLASQYAEKSPYHYTIKDTVGIKSVQEVEATENAKDAEVSLSPTAGDRVVSVDNHKWHENVTDVHGTVDSDEGEAEMPLYVKFDNGRSLWLNRHNVKVVVEPQPQIRGTTREQARLPLDVNGRKIEIGNRVSITSNHRSSGSNGTVMNVEGDDVKVTLDDGEWFYYTPGEIIVLVDKLETLETPKPKFKVGDKVKVISSPEQDCIGRIGKLVSIDDDSIEEYHMTVEFDEPVTVWGYPKHQWYFDSEELEAVDLTLRVGAKVKIIARPYVNGSGHVSTVKRIDDDGTWPIVCENDVYYSADELEVVG